MTTSSKARKSQFNDAESMLVARSCHTSTVLEDGRLFVTSGDRDGATEVFDPVLGAWSEAATMSSARACHAATLLDDGRILISGGFGVTETLNVSEIYSPDSNTWVTTGSLNMARAEHKQSLLPDGRVLATGGRGLNSGSLSSTEVFDPSTNQWSLVDQMAARRLRHEQISLLNGEIMVIGGFDFDQSMAPTTNVEVFNPLTDSWTSRSSLNIPRWALSAVTLQNGDVLVAGGANSSSADSREATAELYDQVSGSWSFVAPMANKRSTAQVSLTSDGKVLVTGGFDGQNNIASAELYSPSSNRWEEVGPLSAGKTFHTSSNLDSGDILIAGGQGVLEDGSFGRFVTVELFLKNSNAILPSIFFLLSD